MLFNNVMIESLEYSVGPERVTSTDLEEQISETLARLKIRPGMLEAISGIHERRFWERGTKPSEVATQVAQKAIEIAGIDPNEIGALVNTSILKDYIEPSVASLIHGNLKLPADCINYDVTNACLGFLNGIVNVAMLIEARVIKYGLVVSGETGRDVIDATLGRLQNPETTRQDFMDNIATLTLGEGASAMILSHRDVAKQGHQVKGAVSLSDTANNHLCVAGHDYMFANPGKLASAGVELLKKTWQLAAKTFGIWEDDYFDLYAPHQVSSHNIAAVINALGLTREKVMMTFPMLGNSASVGLPTSLAIAAEEGKIEEGSNVGMIGIGSGLNSMLMNVSW